MEATQLKLSREQFPFESSLYNKILEAFALQAKQTGDGPPLERDEVLGYLRSTTDYHLGPMDSIRTQAEALGDPALPTPEQIALLEWTQQAYATWEIRFPIEHPLSVQLRKLLPVAAALAITDDTFLVPGAHPMHTLFDTLQETAIGWEPQLGRAGAPLEQLVDNAVSRIQAWFQGNEGDLSSICADLINVAVKDQARVKRMGKRLVESEWGKIRTASARWKAAQMINDTVKSRMATAEISEFLRGPWYDSAQLVLLKFGADSNQWAEMSATTQVLLDSLQPSGATDEERQQRLFEVVTKIPNNIKQWLFSLNMDDTAVDEAVAIIEAAHVKLLRNQSLVLAQVEPLHMEGVTDGRTAGENLELIEALPLEQWFTVVEKGQKRRVQLVMKLAQEQQLQFANQAGVKAMQHNYEEFARLLKDGRATPLAKGNSFSACLAWTAGIESSADIDNLQAVDVIDEAYLRPEQDDTDTLARQATHLGSEFLIDETPVAGEPPQEVTQTEAGSAEEDTPLTLTDESEESADTEAAETDVAPEQQKEEEQEQAVLSEKDQRLQQEWDEARRLREQADQIFARRKEAEQLRREEEAERQRALETTEGADAPAVAAESPVTALDTSLDTFPDTFPDNADEVEPASEEAATVIELQAAEPVSEEEPAATPEPAPPAGEANPEEQARAEAAELHEAMEKAHREQVEREEAERQEQAADEASAEAKDTDPEQARIKEYLARKKERNERLAKKQADSLPPPASAQNLSSGDLSAEDIEIHLPTGVWLGFHDSETPTMARLAVQDVEHDTYIFVNRQGIKTRALNNRELITLMDDDLVEILDARADFRSEVIRIKKK